MIHKTRDEAATVFKEARAQTYDAFSPEKTGYSCGHTFDKYDEVATIARPPIEPVSRRPNNSNTGYIVCMYRVFKGDDGQKFERNWLYWTGKDHSNVTYVAGFLLERVRRVQLHPSILAKGCMHPSILRPDTSLRHFSS